MEVPGGRALRAYASRRTTSSHTGLQVNILATVDVGDALERLPDEAGDRGLRFMGA